MSGLATLVPSVENFRSDGAPVTKGVSGATLSRYMGSQQQIITAPNPLERLNRTSPNYPDYFRDRKLQLLDSIEGFILMGFEWYAYVIPWLVTSEKTVTMNVYRHNVRPATITPNKSVSRVQSHQVATKRATVERFGQSFYIEGDLVGSDEGDRQYIRNAMGLAQGCQLMVNEATITALLECKNYVADWLDYRGRRTWVEDVLNMEIARFAGMAVSPNFLDQVVQASISALGLRSVIPDTIIGWDTMPFLSSMVVNGTKTAYYQTGPDGRDILVQGPDAVTAIRGLALFVVRPFVTNDDGNGAVQYMSRDTTVGEVYDMSFNARLGENFGVRGKKFSSEQRDILIYDVMKDAMRPVSFKEAVSNAHIWDPKTGQYAEQLRRAAAEENVDLQQQNGWESRLKYNDPASLDRDHKAKREINMFFAHDPIEKLVFLPAFIGQFDTDVVHTSALRMAAEQLVGSAFGALRETVEAEIEAARAFLRRYEAESSYDDAYFERLAIRNAPRSIDTQGRWVGERLKAGAPRDYVPNAKGSLDLPANAGQFPGGFANYPGFRTLVADGIAFGVPASTVEGAQTVLSLVEKVARRFAAGAAHSAALRAEASPEWFHQQSTEIVVWELLFGKRMPIFLAAPTGPVPGTAAAGAGGARASGVVNRSKAAVVRPVAYPGSANSVIGTLPLGALLVELVRAVRDDAAATTAQTLIERSVVPNTAQTRDQEKARSDLLNNVWRRSKPFIQEERPYLGYFFVDDLAAEIVALNARGVSAQEAVAQLAATYKTKPKLTQTDAKVADYEARYAALDAVRKAAVDAASSKILSIGAGDVDFAGSLVGGNSLPADKKAVLASMLQSEGETATPMTLLADAIDKVEVLARRNGGDFAWPTLAAWANKLAPTLDADSLAELTSAVEEYNVAAKNFTGVFDSVLGVGARDAATLAALTLEELVEESDSIFKETADEANAEIQRRVDAGLTTEAAVDALRDQVELRRNGGGVPRPGGGAPPPVPAALGAGYHYFRSPLSMTRNMAYTAAEFAGGAPRVALADPNTGFRTLLYTRRYGGDAAESPFADDESMLALGRRSFMVDVGDAAQHDFELSSLVTRHIDYAHIDEPSAAEYQAPAHIQSTNKSNKRKAEFAASSSSYASAAAAAATSTASFQPPKKSKFGALSSQSAMSVIEEQMLRSKRKYAGGDDDDDDREAKVARFMQSGSMFGVGASAAEMEAARQKRERDVAAARSLAAQKMPAAQPTDELMQLLKGNTMQYRWDQAKKITDDLARLATIALMFTESTLDANNTLIDNNVTPLFNVLLWRPHITISMYSLLVLKSGRETGANIIGDRNFQMQDQVVDKILHGHLTFYHTTIIWRPVNVDHLLDIYPQRYLSGWDMSWIETPEELTDPSLQKGSLIAWIYPLGEQIDNKAVSFLGNGIERVLPSATNLPDSSVASVMSMANYYSRNVWQINAARTSMSKELSNFMMQNQILNVVAFTGRYMAWDPLTQQYAIVTEGTGHLRGVKSTPGAANVWNGQSMTTFPQSVSVSAK